VPVLGAVSIGCHSFTSSPDRPQGHCRLQDLPLIGVLLPRVMLEPKLCIEDPSPDAGLAADAVFTCFGFLVSRLLLF